MVSIIQTKLVNSRIQVKSLTGKPHLMIVDPIPWEPYHTGINNWMLLHAKEHRIINNAPIKDGFLWVLEYKGSPYQV